MVLASETWGRVYRVPSGKVNFVLSEGPKDVLCCVWMWCLVQLQLFCGYGKMFLKTSLRMAEYKVGKKLDIDVVCCQAADNQLFELYIWWNTTFLYYLSHFKLVLQLVVAKVILADIVKNISCFNSLTKTFLLYFLQIGVIIRTIKIDKRITNIKESQNVNTELNFNKLLKKHLLRWLDIR